MKLTDMAIKRAKPKEKAYTLADDNGLSLLVETNGSKGCVIAINSQAKLK